MRHISIALLFLVLGCAVRVSAQGTPFSGTPYAIPGTICGANYNKGGEGIAYHDLDTTNDGGSYRLTEGVDIEPVANDANPGTDPGCNFDLGYIQAGEWENYSVNVATAGAYSVALHVAAQAAGGTFHLEFPVGTKVGGELTVPSTTNWQQWTTVTASLTLPAATGAMRIVWDTNGPTLGGFVGNLHYMTFTSTAPTPCIITLSPSTISLPAGGTFTASIARIGTCIGTLSYSVTGDGTINTTSGQFLSGTVAGTATLFATQGTTKSNTVAITVTPPTPLTITGLSCTAAGVCTLPNASVGVPYSYQLTATGGIKPYTWTYTGLLPAGLTGSPSGLINGTPTILTTGSASFSVTVTDSE